MIWLLLLACSKDQVDDSQVELLGPELSHSPEQVQVLEGAPISITVQAVDDDGVGQVTMLYRVEGGSFWNTLELTGSDDGETWTVKIPGDEVSAPAMTYYFKAVDLADVPATTFLPPDPDPDVFSIGVQVVGQALPFEESFELSGSETDLWGLGWAQDSIEFQGTPWSLSGSQSSHGIQSAAHLRGSDQAKLLDDWLITPALDFGDQDRTQVTWTELGQLPEQATHSLWASTGSRIPSDGDFEKVADLAAPQVSWQRSVVVDLSALAGEREVYLAWRYEGAYSDDWFIDQVAVEPLSVDLEPTMSWSPDPVHPGESASISLALENLVDLAGGPLSVLMELPSGGGTVSVDTQEIAFIDALGSASVDFDLALDASWPDNSYLPLQFTVTQGETSWVFPQTMVVGMTSTGTLDLDLDMAGLVQIEVGVGDPDGPMWSEQVYAASADAGLLSLELDLTDQHEFLPPDPSQRWYAKVSSASTGEIQDLQIQFAGLDYSAQSLPSLDITQEVVVYLPDPPDPVLVSMSADPAVVTPGDRVLMDFDLQNLGADTYGAVTATLLTSDADLTLIKAGPKPLSAGVWESGGLRSVKSFKVDVSDTHLDSSTVDMELLLDDGLEQWSVPVELAVPWPVPLITAIQIDDRSGGDNDGLLEPGESADLEIEITNVGDLSAKGLVTGVLSISATSTATASTSGDTVFLGSLSVGASQDKDYDVAVDAGAALGDTLDIVVTLQDSDGTEYTTQSQIVLGEAPWIYVSTSNDTEGDNNAYTVDLINARYRVNAGTFELEFLTAEPFDTATAFIEMWAVASGGDYAYYRLSLQGSTAKLQGYEGGFVTLAKPTVSYPESTTVRMSWAEADMQLSATRLLAGFGAGWCGSETGSYCDHFPDGWGYYYSGYSSSNFYSLKW